MQDHSNLPPEFRRKPEAQTRYPEEIQVPEARRFVPKLGQYINLGGQIWKIVEVKSRGRWKAAFKGENPTFEPQVESGLNFGEPGFMQEIYLAKKRSFWARPVRVGGGPN